MKAHSNIRVEELDKLIKDYVSNAIERLSQEIAEEMTQKFKEKMRENAIKVASEVQRKLSAACKGDEIVVTIKIGE